MVQFQAYAWEARDVDEEYLISIFGRCANGKSVCVTTAFKPYFFIKLSNTITEPQCRALFQNVQRLCQGMIKSYELLKSKDIWGFQNGTKFPFMKLNFDTLASMKMADRKLQRPLDGDCFPQKIYESNIDPILRFMHRTGISSTGWLETGSSCVRNNVAWVDIDLFCNDWKTLRPVDVKGNAPFVVASMDIECFSHDNKFPDPIIPENCIFQIALTLRRLGEKECYKNVCMCLGETDEIPNGEVWEYPTERDMLEGFSEFLRDEGVDMMTGWNTFGFDYNYIMQRAVMQKCAPEFYQLGKLKGVDSELVIKRLSSNALGDNLLKIIPMPGRYNFDLFQEVKREKKLESYKLDFVAETFLGEHKLDVDHKQIFASFRSGVPSELGKVAEYCIQDTLLPHRLCDRLATILNLIEMAKATWVPMSYLSERGQQIKVFSQLTRKARELGYMVPTIRYRKAGELENEDGYEGATVLDAQKGAYYRPITALDFASLYPSIMMAHNLCYSALVMDPAYDNLPGVNYESFQVGDKTFKFVQDFPAVLPELLRELKQFRSQAKRDMKTFPEHYEVFNGKQLAYKISSNSVYGFTGASKGILPCKPIASTVTCRGRQMIEETKNYVEANFPGAMVRYGDTDSVMVEFDTRGMSVEEALEYSWRVGEQASEQCTKLFKSPNDLELEKVYYPYFLYSKKRYAAKLWTMGKDGKMHFDYVDIKGLQVVRRDGIAFTRDTCKELFDIILESNDPEAAKELAIRRGTELVDGRVPMEKLQLSQKLADSYKNENMAHVAVVKKIRERAPGSEPQSGDRVPYVLVDTGDKNARMFEKSEDPAWVREHNIPLDYQYYFTNKFVQPVCDVLEPLVENPKQEIFGGLLPKRRVRRTKVENGQPTITKFFGNKE
jgi:DNA polymerase delta subunit 1